MNHEKVKLSEKLGYGVGDFGANLIFQTIMLFMMYFFTDVFLISASAAGLISFVSKLWDGFTDPVMGYLSDRTRTRWGSKRPYLLFGAVPLGLMFFLLFASPPLPESMKVVYALVLFLLLNTAYTVVNIPYGALTADMTVNAKERSSITGYRMFFAIFATLFIAGATKPLVNLDIFADEAEGFRWVMGFYALLAVMFTLLTFFSVKEKYHSSGTDSFSLSDIKTVLKTNRPFLLLAAGTVFHLAAVSLTAAMINYYFKYVMNREDFIPVAFLSLLGTSILMLPFWVFISNRYSKKAAFNSGMGLLALALLPLYLVDSFSYATVIPLLVAAGAGMSTIYLSPWAMIPDTVEYSQRESGLRREGILYGFFYFGQKLAAGFALLVSGLGLEMSGYLKPEEGAALQQNDEAVQGIILLTTLVPVALIFTGSLFIAKYPIDNCMHAEITEDLKKRAEGGLETEDE